MIPTSNAGTGIAGSANSGNRAAAPDVIVIGEALVDVVESTNGTVEHPGGSPSNVAYGLGLLGIRTALLTSIGDDDRGRASRRT